MTVLPLHKARSGLTDAVNRVFYGHERIAIQRRKKNVAVLVSVRDAKLLEALENKADLDLIRRRMAEPSEPWEKVKKDLGL
jgi:prevent-host-death family protein